MTLEDDIAKNRLKKYGVITVTDDGIPYFTSRFLDHIENLLKTYIPLKVNLEKGEKVETYFLRTFTNIDGEDNIDLLIKYMKKIRDINTEVLESQGINPEFRYIDEKR